MRIMLRNTVDYSNHTIHFLVRHSSILVFFFFFQAEDGIRDYKVTGVQTCALPILTPTSGGTVLKVVAGGTGFLDSLVVSNTYTLPVASTPVCTPGTGTYYNTQSVSCTNPSSAPVVCYTTNGTTPATNGVTGCITGTVVSGSISITSTGTNLQVIAGGSGLTDSSPSSTTYTLIVAAPTFSPAGGSYSSSQNVTVSMTTSGASILYCFDTTNACTPGTSYAGPVAVSSSGFLRAQATLPVRFSESTGDAAWIREQQHIERAVLHRCGTPDCPGPGQYDVDCLFHNFLSLLSHGKPH